MIDLGKIDFQKMGGIIPVIIQDSKTKQVLMLGFMNKKALEQTIQKQQVVFWSRSKNRLWRKGEESGNTLAFEAIAIDCDKDTLLIQAIPAGPTCHTGATSCFDN